MSQLLRRSFLRRGSVALAIVLLIVAASAQPVFALVAPDPPGGSTPAGPTTGPTTGSGAVNGPGATTGTPTDPANNGGILPTDTAVDDPTLVTSPIAQACNPGNKTPLEEMAAGRGALLAITGQMACTSLDWAVRKLGLALDLTEVNLIDSKTVNNNGWFARQYALVRTVSVSTIPILFLIGTIHAVAAGKLEKILKMALVYLPVSVVGSVVAITFAQLLLNITDDLASLFQHSIQSDAEKYFTSVAGGFGPDGPGANKTIWGVSIFMAFGLAFSSAVVYIVLVIRETSIYVAALYLPIGFAMLTWPPTQKYFKKMTEFLVGMILAKIPMVAILSMTIASMGVWTHVDSTAAGAIGLNGTTVDPAIRQMSGFAWVTQVLALIVSFGVAAFAPNMFSKLWSNVSFEDGGRHMATMQNRFNMHRKIDWGNRMMGIRATAMGAISMAAQYPAAFSAGRQLDHRARLERHLGITAAEMATPRTREELERLGFNFPPPGADVTDPAYADDLFQWDLSRYIMVGSASSDRGERFFANVLAHTQYEGSVVLDYEFVRGQSDGSRWGVGGYMAVTRKVLMEDGVTWQRRVDIFFNPYDENGDLRVDASGKMVDIEPSQITRAAENEIAVQRGLHALDPDAGFEHMVIAIHAPTLTASPGPSAAPPPDAGFAWTAGEDGRHDPRTNAFHRIATLNNEDQTGRLDALGKRHNVEVHVVVDAPARRPVARENRSVDTEVLPKFR